jgi:hypothetical protein
MYIGIVPERPAFAAYFRPLAGRPTLQRLTAQEAGGGAPQG